MKCIIFPLAAVFLLPLSPVSQSLLSVFETWFYIVQTYLIVAYLILTC